jgi:dTDP-glucose 4,6-dehydratase
VKVLVTGGAGFIGSNFIRYALHRHPDISIVNLDKLTYAGNLQNLADVSSDPQLSARYDFIKGDIKDTAVVDAALRGADVIVNFAAETHVDRSLESPAPFLQTNCFGTFTLLEAAVKQRIHLFLQISTDEVYGTAPEGQSFCEDAVLKPSNPYAASKASADLLVQSYHRTYGLPTRTVRCTNTYGPFQFPEKLIPLMIANAMENKPLPVYGDGLQVREWLHVDDACSAIVCVLLNGQDGEIYNVSPAAQTTNLQIVENILAQTRKPRELITFVEDRPAHDRRYSLNARKIREQLGWQSVTMLNDGLRDTILWYSENRQWLDDVRSGDYRSYYERHYTQRSRFIREFHHSQ